MFYTQLTTHFYLVDFRVTRIIDSQIEEKQLENIVFHLTRHVDTGIITLRPFHLEINPITPFTNHTDKPFIFEN